MSRAAAILAREVQRMHGTLRMVDPGAATPDAVAPHGSVDPDDLRRASSELAEALLAALTQGRTARASSDEEQVPIVRGLAPVEAGGRAVAKVRVTNEEGTPTELSLYTTNFVSDSGYELPSLRVSIEPRRVTLPPGGELEFEISIAVPAQAPAGGYSGLISAVGCKYVKAVVLIEVR